VVLLTLSNTVQNAIIGDDNRVTGGILGAASLLVTNYLVVRFLYAHEKLDQIVEGSPDVLIDGGKINYQRLKKELISIEQLVRHREVLDRFELLSKELAQLGNPPPATI